MLGGIVDQVPADGTVCFGQHLDHVEARQQIDLQTAQHSGCQHAVHARLAELLDQRPRDAPLALGLILELAHHALQRGRRVDQRLTLYGIGVSNGQRAR